ncbi:hypothetical protein AK973_1993 [Pseudomonas brassicacearum]|nr:hypothetical protein AK973_1993 [Pseudomonas brassicacearum]
MGAKLARDGITLADSQAEVPASRASFAPTGFMNKPLIASTRKVLPESKSLRC